MALVAARAMATPTGPPAAPPSAVAMVGAAPPSALPSDLKMFFIALPDPGADEDAQHEDGTREDEDRAPREQQLYVVKPK